MVDATQQLMSARREAFGYAAFSKLLFADIIFSLENQFSKSLSDFVY